MSTDDFNLLKGKRSIYSFEHRVEIIQSLRWVDDVIPEESWNQKRTDIMRLRIDVFGIGDDWDGRFDDLRDLCNVVYLPRTFGIASSTTRKHFL